MVRDALASALGQAFAGARFSMAGTLDQAQAALDREPETDAVLLDLDMPGMDGLTGLARLRSEHPTVPIIVVSAAREAGVVQRAYEFGASAYIDKSASLEEIAGIVRAVLDGEIFAPPEAVARDTFAQRAAQLTPQQWRVLALMVQGDQNKQIAHKLGVGEATVKAHVTVILRKLGVRSRTQAVIEARGLRDARPAETVRPCSAQADPDRRGSRKRSSARSDAGFTGLCSSSTCCARARRRSVGSRSAVTRAAGTARPQASRSASTTSSPSAPRRDAGRPARGRADRPARATASSASACDGRGRDAQPQPPSRVGHRLAHPRLVVDAEHEALGLDRRRGLRRRRARRARSRRRPRAAR